MSVVTNVKPASPREAFLHFEALQRFETDCWDVNHAISNNRRDFVLLDVRDEESYQRGHLPAAFSLHHPRINETNLAPFGPDATYVVYCAGPHCNGADKAALRLAKLKLPVKKMIGGITGWLDEGFSLVAEKEATP